MLQWAYDHVSLLVGVDTGSTTVTNTVGDAKERYDLDDAPSSVLSAPSVVETLLHRKILMDGFLWNLVCNSL